VQVSGAGSALPRWQRPQRAGRTRRPAPRCWRGPAQTCRRCRCRRRCPARHDACHAMPKTHCMHSHPHELHMAWSQCACRPCAQAVRWSCWAADAGVPRRSPVHQQREAVEAGRAHGEVQVVDECLGGRQRCWVVVPGECDAERAAQRAQAVAVRLPGGQVRAVHHLQRPPWPGALCIWAAVIHETSGSAVGSILCSVPGGLMACPWHGMIATRKHASGLAGVYA
jgi:hypothetical protein